MKLEDGLYVLPSGRSSAAVSVVGGVPAVESLAGGLDGVRLRLEVLHPGRDFSEAKVLGKAVPGAEDRAGFAKSLVKTLFSLPRDAMAKKISEFLGAWTEAGVSFEPSVVMTVLMSPASWRDASGRTGRASETADRLVKTSDMIIKLPAWPRWRAAHQANLASNSEDAKFQKAWISNPSSAAGWTWTKADAEETVAIMKANPAYAEFAECL